MWLIGNGYESGLSGTLSQSVSVGGLFCFRFGGWGRLFLFLFFVLLKSALIYILVGGKLKNTGVSLRGTVLTLPWLLAVTTLGRVPPGPPFPESLSHVDKNAPSRGFLLHLHNC